MLSVPSSAATVAPEESTPRREKQAPRPASRGKLWLLAGLSAVAGIAAASALPGAASISSDVRSGSPGFKQTASGQSLHWEQKALTVYLDKSLDKLGPGAHEAVMQAFGQWVASDTRLPDLSFDTGQTSSAPKQDGKSTVSYGPITATGHEHDVAITITYANDRSGEIIEADVILNSLYSVGVLIAKPTTQPGQTSPNSDNGLDKGHASANDKSPKDSAEAMDCRSRYDAQNVITHEAGHFFGLGEDLVEHQATMFQSIAHCETHKRVLALTDVSAVTTLYAQSADPEEAKAGARACSFGRAPTSEGALAASAGILALSLLRRRRAR